jgi:DNA invertase Pin-like site-specific DNA recombinase
MKIGYARVSTFEQSLDMQLDALEKEGCRQVFTDKVSGIKSSKPAFVRLMQYARPGDTIVVWKLDRLGRNTVKLIELMEELSKRKINLKSLSEQVDTTTATGNLFSSSCVFWQIMNGISSGNGLRRGFLQPGQGG